MLMGILLWSQLLLCHNHDKGFVAEATMVSLFPWKYDSMTALMTFPWMRDQPTFHEGEINEHRNLHLRRMRPYWLVFDSTGIDIKTYLMRRHTCGQKDERPFTSKTGGRSCKNFCKRKS
eukprot:PhF_6_TR25799/c0_g1_i1/m.36407